MSTRFDHPLLLAHLAHLDDDTLYCEGCGAMLDGAPSRCPWCNANPATGESLLCQDCGQMFCDCRQPDVDLPGDTDSTFKTMYALKN